MAAKLKAKKCLTWMHVLDLHVEGVNILFSNQLGISGLPETWIALRGAILCFHSGFFLT